MTDIIIKKVNDVNIQVSCNRSISQELSDHFTFFVPGYKHMPAYRNGIWDGKKRLFNTRNNTIYTGLMSKVVEFAKQQNYTVEIADNFADNNFSLVEAKKFIEQLKLPDTITVRDYQLDAFVKAVRKQRITLLSPTNSGKSLIMYLLIRWFSDAKVLVIVPNTALCHQLREEFIDNYKLGTDDVHLIFSGQEKSSDARITISTWQSIHNLSKSWSDQFQLIMVDEVHHAKAASIVKIMERATECPVRIGLTGTLDGSHVNELLINGLFGPTEIVTTNKHLIDNQYSSELKIKCIILKHDQKTRKLHKDDSYHEEIDLLTQSAERNLFIANLALSLSGNVVLFFKTIEHGNHLFQLISNKNQSGNHNRPIFYTDGSVDAIERNDIRKQIDNSTNSIYIASLGTTSTGINIKNINHLIFTAPSKSRIKTLQSIGRILRRSETKTFATLFDIADDLHWKSRKNFTLIHFLERVKIYNGEQFPYKIYNVDLNKKGQK